MADINKNGENGGTTDKIPALQSLIYQHDKEKETHTLQVLDQLKLPHETVYIDIPSVAEAFSVIKNMQIRGAPLIAIVAVLGLAVDLTTNPATLNDLQDMVERGTKNGAGGATAAGPATLEYIVQKMQYLEQSRPTAVNLQNAMAELRYKLEHVAAAAVAASIEGDEAAVVSTLVETVVDYAAFMLERDTADNRQIGAHGAQAILATLDRKQKNDNNNAEPKHMPPNATLMTICNTGSLATSHYGTALGIVRAVREAGRLHQIVALETRPYNQGSRLTAYEMVTEKMPNATLITDNMAAAFLQQHNVAACVVGADRVCANGDTANKIGTYMLALCAHAHNVPFYVAAPLTTIDLNLATGKAIPIEQRPATELLQSSNAPANVGVWNPAFDVTPAKYITGIVTEKGVITQRRPDGTLNVTDFCAQFISTPTTATTHA